MFENFTCTNFYLIIIRGTKIYLCTLQKIVRLGMYIQVIKQSIINTSIFGTITTVSQIILTTDKHLRYPCNACLVLREANV